jgi:hypothetical protein
MSVINLDQKDSASQYIVSLGVDLISKELGTEVEIYESLLKGLNLGSLSVRGAKATIEAINEVGALPSIAITSCQYLLASEKARALAGGIDQPLKSLINVTIQGTRKLGKKGFAELIETAQSFADLAETVEETPAKEKAPTPKAEGIDALLKNFVDGFANLEDITPKDSELWADFLAKVKAISGSVRAGHPSVKGKKSA